ncbi:hypothetical protein [Flammeovirga aprica]|uniref:Por secretion system C-terminal sorting domain-containing protein n=1 Tax=Flammeovirga aprica JL-4 TaxID=694437 RepID=A0A7X9XD07_9BACT|nr:hypothetical protein [Flammeovirga aprica]NME72357.1 hypothetical protein [Flammeovirga aprica JL-4]
MKKFTILFAALLVSFSLTAKEYYLPFNGISYFFKASANGTSASLIFENLEGQEINFTVKDAAGKTYMNKTVVASGKVKENINFKSLPEGKYTFKMIFEDNMLVRDFYVTESKHAVMMNYHLASSNQKFRTSVVDEHLNIILGKSVEGFVKIKLSTDSGETIYNTKFMAGAQNIKRFDLSTLPQGTYNTELVIDGVTYSDSFSVL